jgi:hypothetical protein
MKNGGSITVKSKLVKNKPTKILWYKKKKQTKRKKLLQK